MKSKASTMVEPVLGTGLRRYLYFTASVTGAAIMIVEILGAKMLSPFIGTSHFVWTAQIAVTLIALAAGYYAGGQMADRSQSIHRLYWAILGAAAWLVLTVLITEPVAYWCLDLNLAVGSLLASAVLYFLPLCLLAMTGPFLVRVVTSSLAGVGGNVGRLTAISTLGSFAGTMLIGYALIPFLPNSTTMYLTALTLLAVCGGFFLLFRRGALVPVVVLVVCGITAGMLMQTRQTRDYKLVTERFRGNSHFGFIQVLDRRASPIRYFLNDNLIQNAYDLERKQSPLCFSYMLAGLPRLYSTNISTALVIGMGVGIVPMEFSRQGVRVDAVEINPAVVSIAERFFDFDPQKVAVTVGDGRHFLNRTTAKYDVVILDAFIGDSFPSHLMTQETFLAVKRVLHSGGSLVVHSFGELQSGRDFLLRSLARTLRTVFPGVRIHTNGEGAYFFVARHEADFPMAGAPSLDGTHPDARKEVEQAFSGCVEVPADSGMVLTDGYNPADYFDAGNRETLRRRLALAARNM